MTPKESELLKALQALYDEQNGPPLLRDKESWNKAMRKAEALLEQYDVFERV